MGSNNSKTAGGSTANDEHARIEQMRVTATVMINDNRTKLRKPTDEYTKVVNSQYWSYGYMGGGILSFTGLCMGIGTKVPVIEPYMKWVGVISGYFAGTKLHEVHGLYLKMQITKVIDSSIDEMQKMDKEHGAFVPEYNGEIKHLKDMRQQIAPEMMTEEDMEAAQAAANQTLDDKADDIVAAFARKQKQKAVVSQ